MQHKKMKKLLSLLLILGLVFSTGLFTYADYETVDPDPIDVEEFVIDFLGDDVAPLVDEPEAVVPFLAADAALDLDSGMRIVSAVVSESAANCATYYMYRKASYPDKPASEFLVGEGDMYLIDGVYYTHLRSASMSEARTFTFEATFDKGTAFAGGVGVGANQFDVSKIDWWYGLGTDTTAGTYNRRLLDWTGAQMSATGSNIATLAGAPDVVDNGATITVTADIRFNSMGASTNTNTAARQLFQDAMRGATIRLHYADTINPLADMPFTVLTRDYRNNYYDVDYMCRYVAGPGADEFIEADGTINPSDGSYGKPDRFIRIQSLGKTSGISPTGNYDNITPQDIWAGIISDSDESLDRYINEIVPMLATDPEAVRSFFDEDDLRLPIVYTNIHTPEFHGIDAVTELFRLICNGDTIQYDKARKIIHRDRNNGYNTMDPELGAEHVVMNIDDLLKKFIFIFVFTQNPDGSIISQRSVNYGFDPNRDGAYHQIPESVAAKSFYAALDPVVLIEFHSNYNPIQLDPCTAPHDPNSEYDLLTPLLHRHTEGMGKGIVGSTILPRYQVPDEHANNGVGFDDACPIYSPNFTMHYGCLGGTVEANSEHVVGVLSCMFAAFGSWDFLNTNYDDMWNFKVEYKRRGVENENTDAKVNPYLFSASPNVGPTVPWPDGPDGWRGTRTGLPMNPRPYSTLPGGSFFPEYYAIPMDSGSQLDVSRAYAIYEYFTRNQVRFDVLNKDTTVGGKSYKAGTFIVNMAQGNRDIANTILNEGTEFSDSPGSLYGEVVMSFPALRGFTCERVEIAGAFDGLTSPINYKSTEFGKKMLGLNDIEKPAALLSGSGNTVIVKNNTLDATMMAFKALKAGKAVNMLNYSLPGYGIRGDFVMSKADFESSIAGFYVEGTAIPSLNANYYKALARPFIKINGSQGTNTLALEKLGFTRGVDFGYQGNTNNAPVPANYNVILNANSATAITDAERNAGIGVISVGSGLSTIGAYLNNPASTTETKFTTATAGASGREALMRSKIDAGTPITAHMEKAGHWYSKRGNTNAILRVPESAVALVTSLNDNHIDPALRYKNAFNPDSFIQGGWIYTANDPGGTASNKYPYADKIWAAAGTYNGATGGAPVVVIASDIFDRAKNEFGFRLMANSILSIAGSVSPLADPNETDKTGLWNAILDAEDNLDSVPVSVNGKEIPVREFWVTAAAYAKYKAAIEDAKAFIRGNALSTDAQISQAVKTLADATAAYNKAKTAGLKGKITSVSVGNGQADVNFDIVSANGKGYTTYLSVGNANNFKVYSNVNYNSKGAHVKGLTNGTLYYVYIEYNDGKGYVLLSDIVSFTPKK